MILKPVHNLEVFFQKSEAALGVFGSKKWLEVYGNQLNIIGIYKDENQLIGGFYYLNTKRFGFPFIKLPPYTPHCGLFFQSESKNQASINSFSKEVITEVSDYFDKQRSALTILAFPSEVLDLQPFIWKNYKIIPNYTYRIDLTQTLEQLVSNFDPKNRNVINKATKEGIEIGVNDLDAEQLLTFFTNALEVSGANIYTNELNKIFKNFSDENNSFSLSAKKGDALVGVVFCVYDKNNCYYLLGGVKKEAKINGVNNLLVLKSIERAKDLGCTTFDFEGSMLKGVEKFFRSFGPRLVPYYTANKGKLLIEMLLKFKKRQLF